METIDLRSDTVSWPTPEMREAMAAADVGDDVYGEDPTVNRLEAAAAARLGKAAGLFVASGTMGNLVSVLAHCGRGDEVILSDKAHIFLEEVGGIAALGGVHPRPQPVASDGMIPLEVLRAAIRPDDIHYAPARLVALENTAGALGGAPLPKSYIDAVGELVHAHGLALHIDGARIFNAAVALDCPIDELVSAADSVTFCLSKGLAAPVGALVVGSEPFIARARRVRKMVGGGMRQAGVLAAAGLIALEKMSLRLADDHATARRLAEGLARLPGIVIDPAHVRTNMVFFDVEPVTGLSAPDLSRRLAAHGVLIGAESAHTLRAVTHVWIKPAHIDRVLGVMTQELANAS